MTNTIPRIDRLKVTNFQSVEKADIELGALTVIVGPSNSGKSALLRALRAVTRNELAPAAVRVGKTTLTASVEIDGTEVAIERGKSHSTYRIIDPSGNEEIFTKAGRTVPEDVQKALHMPLPDGPDLIFSFQIDPPFLLNETGSTAAKTLGDLTNVSKLHEASREANRRRLESSKLEKIRMEDAMGCATAMQEKFGDLPAHASAVKDARKMLDSVKDLARKRDVLVGLLEKWDAVVAAEKDLRDRLDTLPIPADIENLSEKAGTLLANRHVLLDSLEILSKIAEAEHTLKTQMETAEAESEKCEREYHEALVLAGTCPTCNQEVK